MNLLFLVHRIPYPPNKGDKIRSWNELRYLAARHTVHLGCLVDQPEDWEHVDSLRPLVASLEVAPLDPRLAKLRSLGAIISGGALSVRYFASKKLRAYVDNVLRTQDIDAVLLFSSPMADYVWGAGVPMVMDFCDVDSDKWRQYAERARFPMRAIYELEARRLRAYEEAILERCASAALVTQQERALWDELPAELRSKVHVIPNGVDLGFFAPDALADPPRREPHAMAFTGAMDYHANVDAVRYFADEILPRVRATFADAMFYIVGSRPTAEVQALASRPGIVVTGFVDDIRSYYARSSLSVVPLRIARGIQNKVLEAMAMGRPVLASRPAFEGLGAEQGREICVAGDADDFAAQTIALLNDSERAEALGQAGRGFVEREYVWDGNMRKLEELLLQSGIPQQPAPALV